jgi:bifunctional DNA-binding transcriptional regulator/antitoxin component of YhaV-PrlF toxin-antitoxin module
MSSGIVTLDADGRVALTPDQRRSLGVAAGDMVEFWVAEDRLVLRRCAAAAEDKMAGQGSECRARDQISRLAAPTASLR